MISDTTDICHIQPRARFQCNLVGDPIFVCSTMMINMDQCCNGSVIIFHTKKDITWRIEIVINIRYLQHNGVIHFIELWESNGSPRIFDSDEWEQMEQYVTRKQISLDCITMYFVNQVCAFICLYECNVSFSDRQFTNYLTSVYFTTGLWEGTT